MKNVVKDVIIEYVGYGLYDARVSGIEVRGVGNSKMDALIELLKNIQEKEEEFTSLECSINIAV